MKPPAIAQEVVGDGLAAPRYAVLHGIRSRLFGDRDWVRAYRDVGVRVGQRLAPPPEDLRVFMSRLTATTGRIHDLDELLHCNHNSETVYSQVLHSRCSLLGTLQ